MSSRKKRRDNPREFMISSFLIAPFIMQRLIATGFYCCHFFQSIPYIYDVDIEL